MALFIAQRDHRIDPGCSPAFRAQAAQPRNYLPDQSRDFSDLYLIDLRHLACTEPEQNMRDDRERQQFHLMYSRLSGQVTLSQTPKTRRSGKLAPGIEIVRLTQKSHRFTHTPALRRESLVPSLEKNLLIWGELHPRYAAARPPVTDALNNTSLTLRRQSRKLSQHPSFAGKARAVGGRASTGSLPIRTTFAPSLRGNTMAPRQRRPTETEETISLRPHFVKTAGPEQGIYLRVGSTNRRADPEQIEEIRRFVRGSTFDEEPLPRKDSEAIDFRAASECFSSIRKLRRSDLGTLQLTAIHQNRKVPTVGGFLLFGRDRRATFPDAYVRAGRFKGIDNSNIIDSAEIVGYLPQLVEDVLKFIQRNTRHAIHVEGTKHAESYEFPPAALREAVINALVHADYAQQGAPLLVAIFDNRIEIDNPGGLPPGLPLEEIRHGVSKLRNRVIGRVFHELGLIEQWGSGIQRMIGACEQAGLREPVFEEIGGGFRVTI